MTFITTAGWVAQAVKGAVLHGDADMGIARVCTDARKTEPGDLFVGLRGERFDGTDFAADAAARGASAVMVSRLIEGINAVQIVVPDVNQAFCESAAAWRQRFSIPVISVSGRMDASRRRTICSVAVEGFQSTSRDDAIL